MQSVAAAIAQLCWLIKRRKGGTTDISPLSQHRAPGLVPGAWPFVALMLLLAASLASAAVVSTGSTGAPAPLGAPGVVGTSPPDTVTLNFTQGWNLVGNGASGTLDVAAAFGDANKANTVWKWIAPTSRWAFYTPTLTDGGAAYAATKGYDYLTSVNGGEGFWVNAKTAFTAQLPAGTSVSSASFQTSLIPGWNLIATGDSKTASQFNEALSATPPQQGEIPINVVTLWAWNSSLAQWYFFAPSLLATGVSALADYIASKGYLDFGSKILDATIGFWVNKPASTVPLQVDSLSKNAANPLSLVTLNGVGFNPNARQYVRFFDATGYSLEIPAARVSDSAVSVAVPPYIDIPGGRFGSATVSVQLVQRSGSETRMSAVITGFTINPLPTPPLANGEMTDRWLALAQFAAPGVKASMQELETRYPGAPATTSLRDRMSGLETQMAKMRQAINASIGGSPQTLGTFRGAPLTLDAASRDATDQLVYAAILALGPNSPSPCAQKDAFADQYVRALKDGQEYADSQAGYVGGILTCTNTELLDFTTKTVAVLGVLGAVAAASGVALSLPAIATIAAVALVPAVFVMLTQTEAISLSGPSQQAAENLKGAVQLFQDSIFDPLASSLLSVTGQAGSLAYDTFFAFKGATEEVTKHLSSYDIPLSFSSTSSTTTSTTSSTTSTTTVASTTTTTAVSGLGISGSWSGSWSVTSPSACATIAGTWSAVFSESANGTLSGSWQSSDGSGGSLGGTRSGSSASWFVGGSGGASFSGSISGNSISGGFSSPDDCYDDNFQKVGKISGGFSGGKQ